MEFVKQLWHDYGRWADALWLIVAVLIPRRHMHRVYAVSYVLACLFMLRLQVELMFDLGHPAGFLPLLDSFVLWRGMVAYSVIHGLYFALAWFSSGSRNIVFMASSISLFFAGLTLSSLLMVL